MKVESYERTTGMGATEFTAVLMGGEWVRVSSLPEARSLGRSQGAYGYAVEVPEGTPTGRFYRSNSGKERVEVSPSGEVFTSFDAANDWAAAQ